MIASKRFLRPIQRGVVGPIAVPRRFCTTQAGPISTHAHPANAGAEKYKALAARTTHFAEVHGRRPRVLLSTLSSNSEGRVDDRLATVLADIGFDVDIGPLQQLPDAIARQAIEADVHAVHLRAAEGTTSSSTVEQILQALKAQDAEDVAVVVSGEAGELKRSGLAVLLPANTSHTKTGEALLDIIGE